METKTKTTRKTEQEKKPLWITNLLESYVFFWDNV